ncbi:hypothetical protein BDF20DRAFT_941764 [Mycotypha africana]|uniref:uncharacterized protein n=1 Tax=Mycotypha africana TaxID=64632 RepID=UPI0023009388|nr:uncharacterized protein BDF20DRAFT_941764 [Mycotypha africana]KAI8977275.1 hypothetical protein BDF20DRAFT_941764 [Mycotypha africana]
MWGECYLLVLQKMPLWLLKSDIIVSFKFAFFSTQLSPCLKTDEFMIIDYLLHPDLEFFKIFLECLQGSTDFAATAALSMFTIVLNIDILYKFLSRPLFIKAITLYILFARVGRRLSKALMLSSLKPLIFYIDQPKARIRITVKLKKLYWD